MLIPAGVSSPRGGRFAAAALVGVALTMGAAGTPAAFASSPVLAPPADVAPPSPASPSLPAVATAEAPLRAESPAGTSTSAPTPPPTMDDPPGPDSSATLASPGVPDVPSPVASAAASEGTQASAATSAPVRPRFSMSAAVGISVDNHGIADGRNVLVPSFAVQGGMGDGLFGFGVRLFASEAAGRFSSPSSAPGGGNPVADLGADRQALDLLLNVRPFAPAAWSDGDAWAARFLRALTVELGVAAERVSIGTKSIFREGAVGGVRIDVPLVLSGDGSELRATVVARHMLAPRQTVDIGGTSQSIGDSKLEALCGLTVVF